MFEEILREARAAKTWKPSGCLKKVETEHEQVSTGHLVQDMEIKSDTGPSELPSNDEESVIKEFVEEAHCSNVEKEIDAISTFCTWLQSADGGRKDLKLSKQHGSQFCRILETTDGQKRIHSLFNRTLVPDTFFKEYAEKKYTADTIKAYLVSLRHSCSFVMAEKPESVGADCTLVNQMREKARLRYASYRKDSKLRHLDKMRGDLGNLITPEMVNSFEKSESARIAIACIEQFSDPDTSLEVNQSVYTLVRDLIPLQ